MPPPKIKKGDIITAEFLNSLVDESVRRHMGLGGPLGGLGSVLGVPQSIPPPQIRLMEAAARAGFTGDPQTDYGNGGQVFSQECYFVKIEDTAAGYQPDVEEGLVWVYFPTQYRNLEGGGEQGTVDYIPTWHQTQHSGTKAPARFWAILNQASGRWEYMGPPNQVVRFKLTQALSPGSSATAQVMWSQAAANAPSEGETIKVYDWQNQSTAEIGDTGYAFWFPDLGRWETVFFNASSGWLEKPCELYDTFNSGQMPITTDDVTTVLFDKARWWDNDAYEAGEDVGGVSPPANYIRLKQQGLYRIGYNIQWDTAATSGAGGAGTSLDIEFFLGTAYISDQIGAGAESVVTDTGTLMSITSNKNSHAKSAGNASITTWYQRGATETKLRLKVLNASAATLYPFYITGNFWAVWLNHDNAPTTAIVS